MVAETVSLSNLFHQLITRSLEKSCLKVSFGPFLFVISKYGLDLHQ